MRINRVIMIILLLTLLLLESCSTTSSRRKNHRTKGKLSKAIRKSSDKNEGDRVAGTREDNDFECDDEDDDFSFNLFSALFLSGDTEIEENSEDSSSVVYRQKDDGFMDFKEDEEKEKNPNLQRNTETIKFPSIWGFRGGSGLLNNKDTYGYNHFEVFAGHYDKKTRSAIVFSLGLANSPIQEDQKLHSSLNGGISILNFDFTFRKYTTPHYTFLGNYFFAGLGGSYLMWNYRNEIEIEDTDGDVVERISSDSVGGFNLFGGIGFNIIQTNFFHIGGELSPGLILGEYETYEGFENDSFGHFYYLKATVIIDFLR